MQQRLQLFALALASEWARCQIPAFWSCWCVILFFETLAQKHRFNSTFITEAVLYSEVYNIRAVRFESEKLLQLSSWPDSKWLSCISCMWGRVLFTFVLYSNTVLIWVDVHVYTMSLSLGMQRDNKPFHFYSSPGALSLSWLRFSLTKSSLYCLRWKTVIFQFLSLGTNCSSSSNSVWVAKTHKQRQSNVY